MNSEEDLSGIILIYNIISIYLIYCKIKIRINGKLFVAGLLVSTAIFLYVVIKHPFATRLSALHVAGNVLKDSTGKTVILRGVNRSGTEYVCAEGRGVMDGLSDDFSVRALVRWHINSVRIPLNEHCWLGLSDIKPQYGGENYREFIKNYVDRLNRHGIYAILDLHWSGPTLGKSANNPMPNNLYSLSFWQSVAATFKNNSGVLFDLFNEPHPDNNQDTVSAWGCWANGETCVGIPYQAVGMKQLVETIRRTGANNVILLPGVQHANELSEWLAYKPNDPANNLAASWHIYPNGNLCNTTACFEETIAPVIAAVPLIATEVGESVEGNVCSVDGTNMILDWLDKNNSGYLAWTWNTWRTDCGNWSLITNYNGTPKSPNGVNFKKRLSKLRG